MMKLSPFSVRGRRALAVMRDERELSVLRRQFGRLGMTIAECDPDETRAPTEAFDVIIVDADILPANTDLVGVRRSGIPAIALVGTETPSRLKGLLELEPACFLVKPLRSAGLYSALVLAFDVAQERIEDLETDKTSGGPRSLAPRRTGGPATGHASPRSFRTRRLCMDSTHSHGSSDHDRAARAPRSSGWRTSRDRRRARPDRSARLRVGRRHCGSTPLTANVGLDTRFTGSAEDDPHRRNQALRRPEARHLGPAQEGAGVPAAELRREFRPVDLQLAGGLRRQDAGAGRRRALLQSRGDPEGRSGSPPPTASAASSSARAACCRRRRSPR